MDQPDDRLTRRLGQWTQNFRERLHSSGPRTRRAFVTGTRVILIVTLAPLAHHWSSHQALRAWQSENPPEPALWDWATASRGYRSELASPAPPTKPTPRPRRRRRPTHRSLRPTSEAASPARGARPASPGPSASSGGGGPELKLPLEAPDRVWWLAEPPRLLVPGPAGPKLYLGPEAGGAKTANTHTLRSGLRTGSDGQWQDLGRGWGALAQFLRVAPAQAAGQEHGLGAGSGAPGRAAEQARAPRPGPGTEVGRGPGAPRGRDPRRLSIDFAAFPN